MNERVIGMLGGMGPEAALNCFAKIIANTPAQKDQDHLQVIINSNPKVPDRTAAILGRGPSPVPAMAAGIEALERAGAGFVIIPCVSAHVFLDALQAAVRLPILSIFDAVAEAVAGMEPAVRSVGLLATAGTVKGGLFQQRLAAEGIDTVVPDADVQTGVMNAIYTIKDSQSNRPREAVTAELVAAADTLIERGARGIVAGCTEIPLALRAADLRVPYFDSLLYLARAAIRRAGGTPTPAG
jgi:aspartate racemase